MEDLFEKQLAALRAFSLYCGADEAGRGPLAGAVYAAAVCLNGATIEGLDDSKNLSEKKRESLFTEICEKTVWAVSFADIDEIAEKNILGAALAAMSRAADAVGEKLRMDGVLVDGNIARGFSVPAVCVIGGDAKCPSIAAASILAKVSRDREMLRLHGLYPQYNFAKHKGYPTKEHYEMLKKYGPSPIHRMGFLKNLFPQDETKHSGTKQRGAEGERLALAYLKKKGYKLVESNFSTRYGEIDLIVRNHEYLLFVEVKLRKDSGFARAAEAVDFRKQKKLRDTAELWLAKGEHGELQPRFDVIEIYMTEGAAKADKIIHIENAF